ncbi:ATP-binding protein [Micromonospora chersina]|uniref:CalR2-like protein n=1 Tax=Micromonospora chersina TaxID=47854 RepID=B2BM29_9ACTN|nr:BTAD domain-containing putative transcriptional regulator [Micromonospora chersina]ACB47044.1 CalR2-like protein [Micromonospora chersina]SCL66481.1 Predicted ATPase [Micromonospora chersina]
MKRQLSVTVLGTVQVHDGTAPVDLGPSKQRALLALLALQVGENIPVGALALALWGDNPPPSGSHLLHTYVARLRRALEPGSPRHARTNVIASSPRAYRLQLYADQVDLTRFRRLAEAARELIRRDRRSAAFELLDAAVAMWTDPDLTDLRALLPGEEAVAALRREWVTACLDLVTLGLELDRPAAVLATAEHLAAAEPLHEAVQARHLTVLARTGRRAAALDRFAGIRARLAAELGIEPGPELTAAHRELRDGPAAARPAVPPPGCVASRPRPPWRGTRPGATELIGRETDLARVTGLLTDHRVVTVAGPAGCGKSALALAAARRVHPGYADGVLSVDLAAARTPDDVTREIRRLLRLPERGGLPRLLADRHLLLVLDNVDHLTDSCAGLVDDVVQVGRRVSALVTSREPLGLAYESVWRLPPLPALTTGPDGVRGMPAVQLFARRAAQARPGFEVGAKEIGTVAVICGLLDRLPLAVELAADRMADESLDELLRRLDDPLTALRRPDRRGRPAHQTSLSAALQRSLDCLTPAERWCFVRLGALPRLFGLDEVDRVCGAAPWWRLRTSVVLDGLVAKSLVTVRHHAGRPTYAMLRTVHQFAARLLAGELGQYGSAPALSARVG